MLFRSDLILENDIYILDRGERPNIAISKRINIGYAEEYVDKPWRFFIKDNNYVSRS